MTASDDLQELLTVEAALTQEAIRTLAAKKKVDVHDEELAAAHDRI
jgi:hypothetical protein